MRITIGRSLVFATLLLLLPLLPVSRAHACRFWAVVGDGYPQDLIEDQMRSGTSANLKELASSHSDGWGFMWFLPASIPAPLDRAIVRRSRAAADDPWSGEFDAAVDEMIAARPNVAVGHIRHCSDEGDSCRCDIPDPHPFQRDGFFFAHNGTIPVNALLALLREDDPDYLTHHPPDYAGEYIDSELYFLYLLKAMGEHPEMTRVEALRLAIFRLAGVTNSRLNFVLVSGDTLYALRYVPTIEGDPVRYYPANAQAPSFWVASSQALGSHMPDWGTIPPRSLALLVPGQGAIFYPVGGTLDSPSIPRGQGDGRVRPNPARADVLIRIAAPASGGDVLVEVVDAQGRVIWRTRRAVKADAGTFDVTWDGRDLDGRAVPCGSYFCRITAGAETRTERITVVR
jgi:predicted glutamine amidotransferase